MAAKKPQVGKPAAEESTAVTTKKGTSVAVPLINMEQDAGAGFEGATKESFAIPFTAILQSGSPQCKKSDGAYIKGAQEGMFINTATNEITDGDEGFLFVPACYTLTYVEWALRENGGGYRGEHDATKGLAMTRAAHKDDKGRDILPNGNQLNPTHNFYGIRIDEDGSAQRTILSLTSTQIKTAKKLMTTLNLQEVERPDGTRFPAPMFANRLRMTTEPQSNDKGSWFGWTPTIERRLDLTDKGDVDLYLKARAFKDSILKGEVKVADRQADAPVPPVEGDEEF
ncbi:MAG: hypothetical protein A2W25_15320 [candidate division Zixibacteria bacterium RBG_16_53_22]|nr:MAG: hypothetical protein A2W25_15320 [candidate division Zixibacteria bacterium RBG_16_53_22]